MGEDQMNINHARVILICGAREWTGEALMRRVFTQIHPDAIIVHGACRGADLIAEKLAKEFQIAYFGFPAKWKEQGKSAGIIRNMRMLRHTKPDLIIAFHQNIKESKGSKNMIELAEKWEIPVKLYPRKQ
jgi:hypothetical protein